MLRCALVIAVATALSAASPPAPAPPSPADDALTGPARTARIAAIEAMNAGIRALRDDDDDAAATLLESAVARDPGFAYGHLTLGLYRRDRGATEAAAAALRAGLDVVGDDRALAARLANALGALWLARARAAETRAEQRVALTDAIASFDRALAADPQDHLAHHRRGEALDRLDRAAEADLAYRRCIELMPTHSPCYAALGQLYIDFGHADVGLAVLHIGASVNGRDGAMWYGLARGLASAGKHAEAVKAARRGLEIEPDAPVYWYVIGMSEAELGHREEAAEALELFLRLAKGDVRPEQRWSANAALARMQDVL